MGRRRTPSTQPLAILSAAEKSELERIEREAILHFQGQFDELERAIGMLRLGPHLGWKPLVLIHSKRTIAKYERLLGVRFRDIFPEEGPSHRRSIGYGIAKSVGNFWKAVSGETPIEDRKEFALQPPKGS